MDYRDEILKSALLMIKKSLADYRSDRTYKTIVKRIDKKGYAVLDDTGSERIVPCCIPAVTLRPGQSVYVKEPMGKLNELHICGVVGK
jgi:hypothetical protein